MVSEIRQQTHVLAEYAKLVATETENNFENELVKFEILLNKIAQLEKDKKKGLFELDKVSKCI